MYQMPGGAEAGYLSPGIIEERRRRPRAAAEVREALLAFLQSPESEELRRESEQYLAEGKQVTVSIRFEDGKPKYELKIK